MQYNVSFNKLLFLVIIILIIIYIFFFKIKSIKYKSIKSEPILYFFGASWCNHCNNFLPIWNEFVKMNKITTKYIKCDDNKNNELCKKYNISQFPTIIFEANNKIINYDGERTLDDLNNFININNINIETLDNISNKSIKKIYNFNTIWCGYSKRFQPIWDKFTSNVNSNDIQIIDVKCDDPKNNEFCNKYNIPGYPTIISEYNDQISIYEGPRTIEGLMTLVS